MMASIERRIERLEEAAGHHEEPIVCVCPDRPDETSEEAIARIRIERPETPERARFIVVNTGLYRSPSSPMGSRHDQQY
jgi:hypothetical protein